MAGPRTKLIHWDKVAAQAWSVWNTVVGMTWAAVVKFRQAAVVNSGWAARVKSKITAVVKSGWAAGHRILEQTEAAEAAFSQMGTNHRWNQSRPGLWGQERRRFLEVPLRCIGHNCFSLTLLVIHSPRRDTSWCGLSPVSSSWLAEGREAQLDSL